MHKVIELLQIKRMNKSVATTPETVCGGEHRRISTKRGITTQYGRFRTLMSIMRTKTTYTYRS